MWNISTKICRKKRKNLQFIWVRKREFKRTKLSVCLSVYVAYRLNSLKYVRVEWNIFATFAFPFLPQSSLGRNKKKARKHLTTLFVPVSAAAAGSAGSCCLLKQLKLINNKRCNFCGKSFKVICLPPCPRCSPLPVTERHVINSIKAHKTYGQTTNQTATRGTHTETATMLANMAGNWQTGKTGKMPANYSYNYYHKLLSIVSWLFPLVPLGIRVVYVSDWTPVCQRKMPRPVCI